MEASHYYCNAIRETSLILSPQDEDLVYPFKILGCRPVDYNPPLKGRNILRVIIPAIQNGFLWDVRWSDCGRVGCGNGLSVPEEANEENDNVERKKALRVQGGRHTDDTQYTPQAV